ncbi:MAG: formate dehydrogenase accessory sulfurtransferase FdhD [Desulfuromonadales bacterium]|nr:formate dehydrogenase accessory sulfurtransferase FdhD [Desulfuromonadales bacterium]MDH4024805.1 formate dehydrogenase accessory sulfurtransferase FdhD [Desulfuromonadales bacterium]
MKQKIQRFVKGKMCQTERSVVQEVPLRLTVNGRELTTLVASPHQLNFLVAGFLRNQGFVDTIDDFLSLGICDDFGVAYVNLVKEIPAQLLPTLTSGCGTGISFNLADTELRPMQQQDVCYHAAAVFALMQELNRRTEQYRSHGGIHSAAVGDDSGLLLHAEDLGRHNTFDRIAGEALFRDLDLAGKMLVTSGRVSTEMVAKAIRLGIVLIASRTSPTNMAIEMCEAAGISLIGYLRGESFELFSHPECVIVTPDPCKIPGVTGVILAGGASLRMQSDKSLLPLQGARFIDHVHGVLNELFDEVLIVTNSPENYTDIDCRKVPDIHVGKGVLAGIHSGLWHANHDKAFIVGCDMPFINTQVVRSICTEADPADVVLPVHAGGFEPLHALYRKNCINAIVEQLDAGQRRIVSFFPQVHVRNLADESWQDVDPQGLSFRNINTPEEYFRLRGGPPDLRLATKEQQERQA